MTDRSPELEAYVRELFASEDEVLQELREAMESRELPMIQVPAVSGRVLQLLVRTVEARRILEIGTLAGYSAIWMARGMKGGGQLLTLEKREEHAELARGFVRKAGLEDVVEVRVGRARALLPEIGPDRSFDVVFIDADKEGYVGYLEHARRLLRPGGLVLADNAFWKGRVLEDAGDDEATRGVKAFNRALAESPDFEATLLPVGDGVAFGLKR